jgi:8-oxo-dGTP pyrophosphatase MutT (NUDIX family)
MEVVKDYSYGVIPLFKVEAEWKVLLIHQISHHGDRFWIFPKGHAENDETPMQTATRELTEETGVKAFTLDESKKFSMFYTFTHEGVRIDKQVDYFLGYCQSTETSITQPQEVCELRWCSLDEAMELLTHQNTRDVLDEVMVTLEVLPNKSD